MTHILDKLVFHQFGDDLLFGEYVSLLSSAEMIVADNVWRYFEDCKFCERDGDIWDVHIDWKKDIPNIAPPFQVYFVGANGFPPNSFLKSKGYLSGGCLIVARDILDRQHEVVIAAIAQHFGSSRAALKQDGIRWVMYCIPFVIRENWYLPPLFCQAVLVDEDGQCVTNVEMWDIYAVDDICLLNGQSVEQIKDAYSDIAAFVVPPALLATCFCHCRNVELVEHTPNRKQSQARERKRGQPLIKFRTIQIEPIKRLLREEGGIDSSGAGVALHICRGHFKDYRGGKGLFGKHRDIYWWDMQSRGSADLGLVLKDYKVQP